MLSFRDLIDIEEWQKFQDIFSSLTHTCVRTVDPEGYSLTPTSSQSRLCQLLIEAIKHNKTAACALCLPTFLGGIARVNKNLSFSCIEGLHNFLIPLRLHQQDVLAYVIFGPVVLVMRKKKEEYKKLAEEFGVDLETFWEAMLEIRVISYSRMQAIVDLTRHMGELILNLAHRHVTVEEEIATAHSPESPEINTIMHILLDVAVQATAADIGSIMLVDRPTGELTIRASHGLPQEVVAGARVKVGEGLSGSVARDNQALFLADESRKDTRLAPYLKRPYIASAMLVPIRLKEKVVGVMNLGALQTSATRFTTDSARIVNRLLELVAFTSQTLRP